MKEITVKLDGDPRPVHLRLEDRQHQALQLLPGKDDEDRVFYALRIARDFLIKAGHRAHLDPKDNESQRVAKMPGDDTQDKIRRAILLSFDVAARAIEMIRANELAKKKRSLIWTPPEG